MKDELKQPRDPKDPPKSNEERKKAKRKRTKKALLITLIAVMSAVVLAGGGIVIGFTVWTQDAKMQRELMPTASALPVFLDKNGNKMDYMADTFVDPSSIPANVKAAFVALEDKRFYQHSGYDMRRMAKATINNIKAGKAVEGASTITQQLVKNTHLSSEKTMERKLNEIAIAMEVEKEYTKDEILAMYLSVIYFGGGAYGINSASNLYFGCEPQDLTVAQAATLAGILKNPSRYSPRNSIENSTTRRNLVLDVMCREGYISEGERDSAKAEKMKLSQKKAVSNGTKFYIDRAMTEAAEMLGITKYQLGNSGLTITTNFDPALQAILETEAANSANYASSGIDCSTVMIDNATGGIVAHYSTLPYEISRQGGSVMKPLTVYAPALDRKSITLATPIVDERMDFGGYNPENHNGVYYGETTPREAIKKSMNTVAVKVMNYTGAENCISDAKRFGLSLTEKDANLALALGATQKGVTPRSLAGAYSALARGGSYLNPYYVKSVSDGNTKIFSAKIAASYACGEDTAYLLTDCLKDTVKDGTAKTLSVLPYDIAAKTGTVQVSANSNSDAWNISYTTKHTLAVWHGTSSMSERGGGHPTMHAMRIWKDTYKEVSSYPSSFTAPSTIVNGEIDTYSTQRNKKLTAAGAYTPEKYRKSELFSASNRPETQGSLFEETHIPSMDLFSEAGRVFITLKPEEIYYYTLFRRDARGDTVLARFSAADLTLAEDGTLVYEDMPVSLGRPVTYTIKAYLDTNDLFHPEMGQQSKSIFISWY